MNAVAEGARVTPERAGKKISRVRDASGRFIDRKPGPGRPRKDPDLRAACRMRTLTDLERLDAIIAKSKDQWLVLEAVKLRFQYGYGKPVTAIGGPLVNVNLTGASPVAPPANGIDAVVELAADDGSMSPEYRERLLADVFARAERAAARAAERRAAIDVQQEPARAEIPERTAAAAAPAIAAPAPAVEAGVMTEADIEPQELPPAVQAARDAWHAERAADRGEA